MRPFPYIYGSNNKKDPCRLCNRTEFKNKFHYHLSTMEARSVILASHSVRSFCVTCKKKHSFQTNNRLKVLVSSSTMHGAYQHQDYQADFHIDQLTIPGATTRMARLNFQLDYEDIRTDMDVLVVIGLNDVKRTSIKSLRAEVRLWKNWMEIHGTKHNLRHTLAFTETLRPPQYVWFKQDGPTPSNHVCYEQKLKDINAIFRAHNDEVFQPNMVLSLHNDGRRGLKKGKEKHLWNLWREEDKGNMLHLSDSARVSVLKRIEVFFKLNN